jgi:hypothetical protein
LASDSSLSPTAGVTFVDRNIVPPTSATTPTSALSNTPVVSDSVWTALANEDAQVFANGLNVPAINEVFARNSASAAGQGGGAPAPLPAAGGPAGSSGNTGGGASSSGAADSGTAGSVSKPTVNPVLNSLMATPTQAPSASFEVALFRAGVTR